jgi:uncharacterized membrane protein YuzA (DUF378 family)
MTTVIYIIAGLAAGLILLTIYACVVVGAEADRQAEEAYRNRRRSS